MNQAFGRAAALKAVVWTTGSTYISYFLGLVVSVLIARRLDAGDFGRYAYLVWLSGVLVTIANNGLTNTGIKFVSESLGRDAPATAAGVHAWLRRLQPWSIVLVAVAFVAALPLVAPAGWEGHLATFGAIVLVAFAFKTWSLLNTSIAKGYGRFSIEAITNAIATILNAVLAGVLALLRAPLEAYAALFAFTSVAYALVSRVLLRRAGVVAQPGGIDAGLAARLRRHLFWTAALAAIAALGSRSIETFLLNRWAGAADVGFFAIATSLTRAGVELLVAGLSTVMMPIMGYMLGTGDRARAQRIFGDATRYYQFMGLLIAGVGFFWAHALVALMYGERYLAVVPIFRIMVMTAGVLLANGAFSAVLANSDHQSFRVGVTMVSFVVTLGVALALIPTYGVIGAATAQAVSSVLCTIIVLVGIAKFAGLQAPWRALLRQYAVAGIAAALAAAVTLAGGRIAEWTSGLVYGAALVALSIGAGVWRADERGHLAAALSRSRLSAPLARLLEPRPAGGAPR